MNTWTFIAERFPLKVSVPLVAILGFGSLSLVSFTWFDGAVVFTTLFLSLLAIRMVDDLASIDRDRMTHPDRGLPSGSINATKLTYAVMVLSVFVVSLNVINGDVASTLFLIGYYGLYFFSFRTIPLLIKPCLSNVVFCWIPVYVAHTVSHQFSSAHVLLGLFAYCSAIAHEYAHSVHAANEAPTHLKTYATLLGSRFTAALSLIMYILACVMGLMFWYRSGRPTFFMGTLVVTSAQIIYLEIRLILEPTVHRARSFYVSGYTFFLLPYLALVLDRA